MIYSPGRSKQFGWVLPGRGLARLALAVGLLLGCAADLYAQTGYGGPSLLSRGGNRPGRRGRAPVDLAAYLGVRGIAESGLLRSTLEDGTVVPRDVYGATAEAGIYGGHDWRHSSFGVDYRGDYRYNTRFKQFNGFNQAISLEYQKQLSRRLGFAVNQVGGISNRAFGAYAAPAFGQVDRYGVPLNEVYDVKTYYGQTSGALSWRKSARTTFVGSGQAFFIKRDDFSLINGQGYVAGGQALRRMSRRTEIGLQYQFVAFEYPRVFTTSHNHIVSGLYRHEFGRSWSVDILAGITRIDATGTQTVQLSPEIAFILGQTTGVEAFNLVQYIPQTQATLAYTLQQSRFSLNYFRGLASGNGVLLTAERQTVNAGYSYAGIRRTSLGASAGWSEIGSIGPDLGTIRNFQAGVGATYKLAERLDFSLQADYRTFSSPGLSGREGYAITIGLNYSTSRLPLSIW